MTNDDIREAHKLLDSLFDNSELSHAQIDLIRGLVPELPKQLTLEDIAHEVNDAWVGADGNEWPDDAFGELETWLKELHEQLKGLALAESAHPEFLRSEADYAAAPEGTIVAVHGSKIPTIKDDGWPVHMAVMPRRVLRWGWQ